MRGLRIDRRQTDGLAMTYGAKFAKIVRKFWKFDSVAEYLRFLKRRTDIVHERCTVLVETGEFEHFFSDNVAS